MSDEDRLFLIFFSSTWEPLLRDHPIIVGSEVDDSIERLHADIMAFGQALHDRVFTPGTWTLRPGAASTDAYRFYQATWEPFMRDWLNFRSEKRDIPWQTLPGSGTAGALRNFRERFVQVLTQAKQEWLLTGTGYTPPRWASIGGDLVGRGGRGGRQVAPYYGYRRRHY